MPRFAHIRNIALPLIFVIALTAVVVGLSRAKPDAAPSEAPAAIDSAVPANLSTATFGLG
jgi:hypothetical protein